jgi:hypothetical protein
VLLSVFDSPSTALKFIFGFGAALGFAMHLAASIYLVKTNCPVCGQPFVKRGFISYFTSLEDMLSVTCQHCRSSLLDP